MTTTPPDSTKTLAGMSAHAWTICLLMLMATMLNYMDRQALAQQATEIGRELDLSNEDYGRLEYGFGLAFAVGGILFGFATDRLGPRWLYPGVLLGWSAVGVATGSVRTHADLFVCRILLGFFEAGLWPCALVTSQRLLSRENRPLGNSLIQSGASLGAIATPFVVLLLADGSPSSWRLPFRVIGASGILWVVAWLMIVRPRDLDLNTAADPELAPHHDGDSHAAASVAASRGVLLGRLAAVIVVVIVINLCFQYFRAWMPKMLREQHGYSAREVQIFSIAFYLAADAGCLGVGFLVKWLVGRGWRLHSTRMSVFFVCALMTALSTAAAILPASWMLLGVLLVIAFGSLGQFPIYYALTQEITAKRMGNLSGLLGFVFWSVYALVQTPIGRWIDHSGTYSHVTFIAGLLPMIGFLALLGLWNPMRRPVFLACWTRLSRVGRGQAGTASGPDRGPPASGRG